ncbi:MAG: hypothetical protein H7831_10815 [Magnetococcus sp. WYHC-3]
MLRFKQFLLSESMVTTGVSTPSDGLGVGGLNQPILNPSDTFGPLNFPLQLDDRWVGRDEVKPGPGGGTIVNPPQDLTPQDFQQYYQNNPPPEFPGPNATQEQRDAYNEAAQQWLTNFLQWLQTNNYNVPDEIENIEIGGGSGPLLPQELLQQINQFLQQLMQAADYVDLAQIILWMSALASGKLNITLLSGLIGSVGLATVLGFLASAAGVGFAIWVLLQIPSQFRDWEEWIEEYPLIGGQWWRDWYRENQGIGWPDFQRMYPMIYEFIIPFGEEFTEWWFGQPGSFEYNPNNYFIPNPNQNQNFQIDDRYKYNPNQYGDPATGIVWPEAF